MENKSSLKYITPSHNFDHTDHYYEKAKKFHLHPIFKKFLTLTMDERINIYKKSNPNVDSDLLKSLMGYRSKYFYWMGNDFFPIQQNNGQPKMIVLESNSCPSGNKALPVTHLKYNNYQHLIKHSFIPAMKSKILPEGYVAVIYDTNPMENECYANIIANLLNEKVIAYYRHPTEPHLIIYKNGQMFIDDKDRKLPLRAVFRYLTQKPWQVFALNCKTFVYNPIEVCLAGGRNKLVANKAYEWFNKKYQKHGLNIVYPDTTIVKNNVDLEQKILEKKYKAVIKIPYLNKGQGVFTLCNKTDWNNYLDDTKDNKTTILLQNLVGNKRCSTDPKWIHRYTKKDRNGDQYIYDLRMICCSSSFGIIPVSGYARRALLPVDTNSTKVSDSWEIFGTNISVKKSDGSFGTDPTRLITFSVEEFDILGLDIEYLVFAYVQCVFTMIAIDQMCQYLFDTRSSNSLERLSQINYDLDFLKDILVLQK